MSQWQAEVERRAYREGSIYLWIANNGTTARHCVKRGKWSGVKGAAKMDRGGWKDRKWEQCQTTRHCQTFLLRNFTSYPTASSMNHDGSLLWIHDAEQVCCFLFPCAAWLRDTGRVMDELTRSRKSSVSSLERKCWTPQESIRDSGALQHFQRWLGWQQFQKDPISNSTTLVVHTLRRTTFNFQTRSTISRPRALLRRQSCQSN